MAKARSSKGWGKKPVWITVLGLVLLAGGIALNQNRETISGMGLAGTAYSARVACSCRFVAGRSLDSCESDMVAGTEVISLSEDVEARSVTATLPLVQSTTATYREGYGCVLEKWDG